MKKYCIIGEKLSHTLSPLLHKNFGVDYSKVEIAQDELADFVKNSEYDGYNVTVPYKKDIIPFLDDISPLAKKIGAVNTVVKRNGRICGFNTDFGGMAYALTRATINLKNENVLILGTGGTSNTAGVVCETGGAKSIIKVGRTSDVNYENIYDIKNIEVIINTTPVGMFSDMKESPIKISKFRKLKGVFDAVYNPLHTRLIREARALNIPSANGLFMLVEQARLAENIFHNCENKFSVFETERIVDTLYKNMRNIVLTGMPSSGKTTLGKIVAKLQNKRFIDLDNEICKLEGCSVEEIFSSKGEEYFRRIETKIIEKVSGEMGSVISTGGGAVTSPSFDELRGNGYIVYIKRDLSLLETKGRPLAKEFGVQAIYNNRKGLYESADIVISNDSELDIIARRIIEAYEKNSCY